MDTTYWIKELENTKKNCNTIYTFPEIEEITNQLIKLYYERIDLIDSILINSESNNYSLLLKQIEINEKKTNVVNELYLKQKIDFEKDLFNKIIINTKKPKKIID